MQSIRLPSKAIIENANQITVRAMKLPFLSPGQRVFVHSWRSAIPCSRPSLANRDDYPNETNWAMEKKITRQQNNQNQVRRRCTDGKKSCFGV